MLGMPEVVGGFWIKSRDARDSSFEIMGRFLGFLGQI